MRLSYTNIGDVEPFETREEFLLETATKRFVPDDVDARKVKLHSDFIYAISPRCAGCPRRPVKLARLDLAGIAMICFEAIYSIARKQPSKFQFNGSR